MQNQNKSDTNITYMPVDFDPFAEGELSIAVPATESQKEIWASVQMCDEANLAYNESVTVIIHGPIDVEILKSSFQELIKRHEILRSTFNPDGETLCISSTLEIDIPVSDFSEMDDEKKDDRLNHIYNQVVEKPFDLQYGPLLNIQIIKLNHDLFCLVITTHHIICDGWSIDILVRDVSKIYTAKKHDEINALEPPDRFSDYAALMAEHKKSSEAEEINRFWIEQFSEGAPILDFPTDRPRLPIRTYNAAREDKEIEYELIDKLRKVGSKAGCTLLNILLAGFVVFLHRLTQQEDIVVGLAAAGQSATGRENLVGHCVNLLPIRCKVNSNKKFIDFIRSFRDTLFDAYDHQQITFGTLVKKLKFKRDLSTIPLIPVVFNIDQGIDIENIRFDNHGIEFFTNQRHFENFEIFFNIVPNKDNYIIECSYNTDLFDKETIVNRMEEYIVLLKGIIDDVGGVISELPILSDYERHKLLVEWSTPLFVQDSSTKCIHEMFELQANLKPNFIAACFEGEKITYAELNRNANQLANKLIALGIDKGMLVGLYVEPSIMMLIAILGILKSGAAYVPLNPMYPKERLLFIIKDSDMPLILTLECFQDNLPDSNSQILLLDTEWSNIIGGDEQNPNKSIPSTELAYIIYTSGTTGNPKGVMVSHYNVVRLFINSESIFKFDDKDVWTLFHSYAFDFSVWELWGALFYGGRLVIVPSHIIRSPEEFYELLSNESVTVLNQTPSAFSQMLKVAKEKVVKSDLPNLRLVIFGGEVLNINILEPWLRQNGDQVPLLVNMYGITETTVHVTYYIISKEDLHKKVGSIIGRPLPDLEVYILDEFENIVPIGQFGEIVVGGAGVARGYLNQSELTRKKFIKNKFSNDPDAVLYKSGDIARFLSDGNLEYLSRKDDQIKIRGYRIELCEIESILKQFNGVVESVVIAREDISDDKEKVLVAYIVLSEDKEFDKFIANLKIFVRNKLPAYMIPSFFVKIDSVPLTENGKLAKKSLPLPDFTRYDNVDSYVSPETANEKDIAEIFSEFLNIKRIGIHDNFFELGGHSIMAIKIISKMRSKFNIMIPMGFLFQFPTVYMISQQIDALRYIENGLKNITDRSAETHEEFEI